MSEQVVLFVTIVASPGCADDVKGSLQNLTILSRNEPGCITFDLHVSCEDAAIFKIYEIWNSSEDLEAHRKTAHYIDTRAKITPITQSIELDTTRKI